MCRDGNEQEKKKSFGCRKQGKQKTALLKENASGCLHIILYLKPITNVSGFQANLEIVGTITDEKCVSDTSYMMLLKKTKLLQKTPDCRIFKSN